MTRKRITVIVLVLAGICLPAVLAAKQLWAKSYLGRKAPSLVVEKWLTPEPQRNGKFLLIDFWATWCGPCLKAIPELNEIHRQFGDRVAVIGISDETEDKVRRMKSPKMEYAVAIDTAKRMKEKLAVKGIPHVILVDPSGIVRWEGFHFWPKILSTHKSCERYSTTMRRERKPQNLNRDAAVPPHAIVPPIEMKPRTPHRDAARGAPATVVPHLYQNVGGSRITNKIF